MHRSGFLVRLGLVSFTLMACGPSQCCRSAEVERYEDAHRQSIGRAVDGYEFTRPLAEAWPEILAVCSEHGYRLDAPSPVEGRTLESDFKPDEGGGASRLLVRVIRVDAARWKVTFDLQYRSAGSDAGAPTLTVERGGPGTEGHDLAWTLLQRLEPAKASEIELAAKQKGERAGETGRGYDRGCNACVELATPK